MGPLLYCYVISIGFLILTTLICLQTKRTRLKNLPPSPPTLPIIGNLHHLNPPLHRTFHALSQTHGPIFSLWFGSRLAVVVSSLSLAQQCFSKYDTVLANRPRLLSGKYLFYNSTSAVFSSYGDHWRNLRRIATTDILSAQRLKAFAEIRKEEIMRAMRKLVEDTSGEGFTRVQLRPMIQEMLFNSIMRMVCGKTRDDGAAAEEEFREIISEILGLMGAHKEDFMPEMIRWLDMDGLVKRMKRISVRADAFLQGLLEEHRRNDGKRNYNGNTMIEHLLILQKKQPDYYSDHIIKALVQDILLAGTDTTAMTIEWALAALFNQPEVLKKAKGELDTRLGKYHLIDESDIPNLPYLQYIMYEALRLYPPGPLLMPHYSSVECNIGGFTIPRDTIVLFNAWTIQRDVEIWSDAESFKPERFEKEGETNKLFAFGSGKRACPGSGLAYRTMGLILGLLIQCFEWKRLTDKEIDMREEAAHTLPMLIPLEAMCKPRPISEKIK